MEDGDSVIEHLNSFNTLVSWLIYFDIKMEEEDKCITLLCSALDAWDNLVVVIGSTTYSTLKFVGLVSSLLSKEMRRKSKGKYSTYVLSVTPGCTKERKKSTAGGL